MRRIYSIYAFTVFLLIFILLFPLFFIFLQKEKWHPAAVKLNRFWATTFFRVSLMKYDLQGVEHIQQGKQYIFCPNHFSYLDIPSMGLSPRPFKYVGKNSISRVPLFGYMFRKLHITVDRSDFRDRHRSYEKSMDALRKGFNLVIFPEGGIMTKNPPEMVAFKEGAFRMATELQIPIIPVTIPYNWILLPDDDRFLLKNGKVVIRFHEPVDPEKYRKEDSKKLKEEVFRKIESDLKSIHGNESRQANIT